MSLFKDLIDARYIWSKGLQVFSSKKLKSKNYQDWKWRTELKPGKMIECWCRRLDTWVNCKIVTELDKQFSSNVILVRLYAHKGKCNHSKCFVSKSHLQLMNRCVNIYIYICIKFF